MAPYFLDAPSHLYMRSCPSVRRSVGPSVRRSVCLVLFSKMKSTHTRRILCRVSGLVLSIFSITGSRLSDVNCLQMYGNVTGLSSSLVDPQITYDSVDI